MSMLVNFIPELEIIESGKIA